MTLLGAETRTALPAGAMDTSGLVLCEFVAGAGTPRITTLLGTEVGAPLVVPGSADDVVPPVWSSSMGEVAPAGALPTPPVHTEVAGTREQNGEVADAVKIMGDDDSELGIAKVTVTLGGCGFGGPWFRTVEGGWSRGARYVWSLDAAMEAAVSRASFLGSGSLTGAGGGVERLSWRRLLGGRLCSNNVGTAKAFSLRSVLLGSYWSSSKWASQIP